MFRQNEIVVPVAGTDGSATGTATTNTTVDGWVVSVVVKYTDQPDTCNVELEEVDSGTSFFDLDDNDDDGEWYPFFGGKRAEQATGGRGATRYPAAGRVKASVSDGNAGTVKIILKVEC